MRMRDTIAHRGPDGEGLIVDGPVGSRTAASPSSTSAPAASRCATRTGRVWIVFNGEIYNHADAAAADSRRAATATARAATPRPSSTCTRRRASACVERPAWHVCLRDLGRPRQRLLLARDRLGIKPLYYARTEHELLFASEIKAVLAAGGIRPQFNEDVLPEFLANRFVSGGRDVLPRRAKARCPGTRPVLVAGDGIRIAALLAAAGTERRPSPRRFAEQAPVVRGLLEVGGAQPPDERRAARRVPVRRARLERAGRDGGAQATEPHSNVRRRLRGSRGRTNWTTRGWWRERSAPSIAKSW